MPEWPPAELESWAVELVKNARVGRLGLLDAGGAPRVMPVTFAVASGLLWTAIDRKPKRAGEPARIGFVRADARVALTVDRYDDDWSRLAWVQVLGEAEIVASADAPEAMAALAGRYEPYRADAPPGPLIAITPRRAIAWRAG